MTTVRYILKANIQNKIKIALVTDLHNEEYTEVIKAIENEHVDFIAVAGDFVHNALYFTQALGFLKRAAKIAPTFCSIGNHESKFVGDLNALVTKSGAILLDNSAAPFRDIMVGGLSTGFKTRKQGYFRKTPPPNMRFLTEFAENDCYKVLLSHHPEYYPKYIKPLNINLILSGHAHGGQWRIFGQGIYAPGQGLFPELTDGIVDGRLIISRGIGNPHKIPRINNDPELVLIELSPGK